MSNNKSTVPISEDTSPYSRMFALLIGINKYASVSGLAGAIADVDDVQKYLRENLKVGSDRIQVLKDVEATREGIKAKVNGLKSNPEIMRDDPILIFYAGHGSSVQWTDGEVKEAIVPQDASGNIAEMEDAMKHLILDFEFGQWLNALAAEKGNYITVIFDCCHSTSGARDLSPHAIVAREVYFNVSLGEASLEGGPRGQVTPEGFMNRDCRSHILLAACGKDEKAQEINGRGCFTVALLEKLRQSRDISGLSYEALMGDFPGLSAQNPQYEGYHSNRLLFGRDAPHHSGFFRVRIYRDKTYRIQGASGVYGIHIGSFFDLYENDDSHTESLGKVSVTGFRDGDALVKSDDFQKAHFARHTGLVEKQKLRVYCASDFGPTSPSSDAYITIVEDEKHADLILDRDNGETVFKVTPQEWVARWNIVEHGYNQLHKTPTTDVEQFLLEAANWNLHLNNCHPGQWDDSRSHLQPGHSLEQWIDKVQFEFVRLEEAGADYTGTTQFKEGKKATYNSQSGTFRIPGEGGQQDGSYPGDNFHLKDKDVIELFLEEEAYYGVKILNDSQLKLYAYLFGFDATEQKISRCFSGPLGGVNARPDLTLPPNKLPLTIGYGTAGALPLAWELSENMVIDISFLKLYLSTTPLDVGLLEKSTLNFRPMASPDKIRREIMASNIWGTITCMVVQYSSN